MLPVPQEGFFNTEQAWRLTSYLSKDGTSLEQAKAAYNAPEGLASSLTRQADKIATALAPDSCVVPLYLGGKGRVVGTRFVQLLKRRIEPARIAEQGHKGALNLNSSVILKLEGFNQFRTDDVVTPVNREAIRRHVFGDDGPDDPLMAGLRAGFRAEAVAAVRLARALGLGLIEVLLVDDQVSSGLTSALAEELLEEAIANVQASYGQESPPIRVHLATDLVPNWDYVPRKLISAQVEQLLPTHLLVNYLGLSGINADEQATPTRPSSMLRNYLIAKGISPDEARRATRWISHSWYDIEAYILRGGFADKDERGMPLYSQRAAPDHVIAISHDHYGRSMTEPIQVDVSQAVEAYNREFDQLIERTD